MARPLRLAVPNGWYHVTVRGNERKPIFRAEEDRLHFLELLGQTTDRFALVVHAYTMMDNHYHLIVQTPQANLSAAMQWLGVSYSVWFNRRHRRVGHLFQGRFKGLIFDGDDAWELSRYVHLNPVRVARYGLGKEARQQARQGTIERPSRELVQERLKALRGYRWSSYRVYVGLESGPEWLTSKAILQSGGGGTWSRKRGVYRQYVEEALREGLPEAPWDRLTGQVVLGTAEFVEKMKRHAVGDRREQPSLKALESRPGWEEVKRLVEKVKEENWEEFRDRHGDWGRDMALYVARRHCGIKLKELGERVGGLDYGSVAGAIGRFGAQLLKNRSLRRHYDWIKHQLIQ